MLGWILNLWSTTSSWSASDRGGAVLVTSHLGAERGGFNLAAFASYVAADRGGSALLAAWAGAERGLAPLIFQTWSGAGRGAYSVLNQSWLAADRGVGRLANVIPVYAAWVSPGSPPAITGTPDASGDTLPLTLPLTAGVDNYIIVAKRNEWGLTCLIPQQLVVTLAGDGTLVLQLPTAPTFTAEATADLKVRVRGSYHWGGDDALGSDADTWLVYTRVGADPAPGSDTPASVAMDKSTYEAVLDYTPGSAFTAGQVVHVLVTVKRSADSVASTPGSAAQVTIAGSSGGPTNPRGLLGDELAVS